MVKSKVSVQFVCRFDCDYTSTIFFLVRLQLLTTLLSAHLCSGGIYLGKQGREELPGGGVRAYSTSSYTLEEVERIARAAFGLARQRSRQLVSVDLANYLEVSVFWREVGLLRNAFLTVFGVGCIRRRDLSTYHVPCFPSVLAL